MTNLKDIVFETDRYWVKRVPKGFEVYKTGLTHSTRVAIIGYTGDKGLQRAKDEIARREDADPASTAGPSGRHHATKKSPAQLQREINEALVPRWIAARSATWRSRGQIRRARTRHNVTLKVTIPRRLLRRSWKGFSRAESPK